MDRTMNLTSLISQPQATCECYRHKYDLENICTSSRATTVAHQLHSF